MITNENVKNLCSKSLYMESQYPSIREKHKSKYLNICTKNVVITQEVETLGKGQGGGLWEHFVKSNKWRKGGSK